MRRTTAADGPVRRTVLAGALGLTAALLTGCGIRLDRDPALPELSPDDLLRDAVARALAAIDPEAGAGASDPVRQAVQTFAEAVGPPWNPPADLAEPVDPPHTDPPPTDAATGLADVARLVAEAVGAADGSAASTPPVLVVLLDVTAGALLHLDDLDADAAGQIRSSLADSLAALLEEADDESAGPSASATGTAADGATPAEGASPLEALATACYAAEYAYERAAVHLTGDDPARSGTSGRIARLQGIVAALGALAPGTALPSDRPAWDLPEDPHDAATARTVLQSAEDHLVAVLLDAQASVPPAAFAVWLDDSARARSRAEGPQDLRFEVRPVSQESDSQEDAA